jgi:hypothetical protein
MNRKHRKLLVAVCAAVAVAGLFAAPRLLGVAPEHEVPLVACMDVALIVALAAVVDRSRRRKRRSTCACGYDLRASPVRCTECGRFVLPPPAYVKGEW